MVHLRSLRRLLIRNIRFLMALLVIVAGSYLAILGEADQLPPLEPPQQSPITREYARIPQPERLSVKRVIDGDTLVIEISDREETVRIIGIDTPELGNRNAKGECLAEEARSRVVDLTSIEGIELVTDGTQDTTDRYGRALRSVLLASGDDLGMMLIREGLAREYTYRRAHRLQAAYRNAEAEAQRNSAGIWNPSLCPAS